MFWMTILLILSKFHQITLRPAGDIRIFHPGRRMYMNTLPSFMDEVLRGERDLMKWVVIFLGGGKGGGVPGGV